MCVSFKFLEHVVSGDHDVTLGSVIEKPSDSQKNPATGSSGILVDTFGEPMKSK